jgi:hypothetical protein
MLGAILLSVAFAIPISAQAWPIKVKVSDGDGEQFEYKKGILGDKKILAKDRIGDQYENSRGIFGITKTTQVGVLGNGVKHHRGIIPWTSETDAHSMFGDSFKYKKNVFGYRTANVDVHGISDLLSHKPSTSIPNHMPQSPTQSPDFGNPGGPDPSPGRIQPEDNSLRDPLVPPNSF